MPCNFANSKSIIQIQNQFYLKIYCAFLQIFRVLYTYFSLLKDIFAYIFRRFLVHQVPSPVMMWTFPLFEDRYTLAAWFFYRSLCSLCRMPGIFLFMVFPAVSAIYDLFVCPPITRKSCILSLATRRSRIRDCISTMKASHDSPTPWRLVKKLIPFKRLTFSGFESGRRIS